MVRIEVLDELGINKIVEANNIKIEFTHLYCDHCKVFHYINNIEIQETTIDGTFILCKETRKVIIGYRNRLELNVL